jgi:hypothetical protein
VLERHKKTIKYAGADHDMDTRSAISVVDAIEFAVEVGGLRVQVRKGCNGGYGSICD